ncbi:aminoacyl-histidine dipeptidase [Selenomonas sp. TAMA-11512]|uniref:beta-Ala-His dipeptidase n=1 Tax=Selenomonas sp. TAMA-11512 TaxID=3095337 RepID=UPI00308B11AD|nr:aminoacyl-histidine dipeptidase [Selenomonas sp. TAMA-11512]
MLITACSDAEIIDGVLKEFAELARIPRPSGQEKSVSDYLKKRFEALGLTVVQDEVYNIIADLPASDGLEDAPRIILQCHMDMVCVADEGVVFDPLKDAIKLHRTETCLTAVGTSLGADDGMGIAAILCMIPSIQRTAHAPVRIICTVDEERGMTGAIHLDSKYLQDAVYLINADSENYDELTVGSAGSVNIDFSKRIERIAPRFKQAWSVRITGLNGGHSGERIGDNRANGASALASFFANMESHDACEIAAFSAGTARNAIPASGEATFVTDAVEETLRTILMDTEKELRAAYGMADPNIRLMLESVPMPISVADHAEAQTFLRLLRILHSGVYAMSLQSPLQVETSANLGIARLDEEAATVCFFPRSSNDAKIRSFIQAAKDIAYMTGYRIDIGNVAPGWQEKPKSALRNIMTEVFQEQNGRPMKVQTIHAGLECGYYAEKNPELDMVSIGVTTKDIHSPKESVILSSIPPIVRLMNETLARIFAAERG